MDYNSLCERVFLPLADLANHTRVAEKLRFLGDSQWWSDEELRDYQSQKLRGLVSHAYNNVPYYRALFDECKINPSGIGTSDDLGKLPLFSKEQIRGNPQEFISKNHGRMTLYTTSGSTGEPMRFYVDKEADGWKWACALRGWGWAGYRVGDRHALLSGNPNRGIKKMKDILLRCAYMQTVKINDPILDGYLRAIQKNGVRFLAGYASAVHLLAKRAEERGVELHLNGIVTFGETLTQPNRKTIEETFGCGVNDTYGLGGEALIVADQCEKRGCYHVHMENVVAERVDGEIVLTGLNNYAMPLIRYRTGDYAGEICSGCGCGRGLLSFNGITGRSGDVVVTASGAKLILEFFVVLFEKIPTVKQFQVLQDSVDGITLRIVRNSGFTDRDLNRIRGEIAMACDRELKVEFEFVDEIKSSGRGKRRLIISAIDDG